MNATSSGAYWRPLIFSVVLLAGRITDGVSDPFVAFWTDNARTRRGRRMPFILFGALPFAIICLLLWTPPVGAVPWVRTVYSVVVTQLFFLGYAVVVTPYLALLPEIAGSTVQRLNLTTGQAIGAMVGTLVFATLRSGDSERRIHRARLDISDRRADLVLSAHLLYSRAFRSVL